MEKRKGKGKKLGKRPGNNVTLPQPLLRERDLLQLLRACSPLANFNYGTITDRGKLTLRSWSKALPNNDQH